MKSLQRIIDDLKRGENIDLYATVTLALIVAVLNLLGIAPQGLLNSLSLAIFALIASAILGNRYRLENIQQKLNEIGDGKLPTEFPKERSDDIQKANEMWIFGVHVNSILRHYRGDIETKLRNGKTIRVLLVNPFSAACEMAAARNTGIPSTERERASIIANLNDLCELRKIGPSKLYIRVIDDPMMYGGCMLNPESSDGVIYIQRYSYQTGVRPKLTYHPQNEWFNFIRKELGLLWERGKEWECDGN